MSYNERLQTNNTDLQSILDTINALPGAGSSGGSVETCEVTILQGSAEIDCIVATIYDESSINVIQIGDSVTIPSIPYTINNVVCGSAISIFSNNGSFFTVGGDCSFIGIYNYMKNFKAPTDAGATGTIQLNTD